MIKLDDFIKRFNECKSTDEKVKLMEEGGRRYIPLVEKITLAKSVATSVIFDSKANVHFDTMYADSLLIPSFFKAKYPNIDIDGHKKAELYDIVMSTPTLFDYVVDEFASGSGTGNEPDYYIISTMMHDCIEDAKLNYTSNYALATVFAPQISQLMRKYIEESGEKILTEDDNENNTHS